jgi:transposase-like protein
MSKFDKKKQLIECLKKSKGIVADACKSTGISRGTFYNWCKEDAEFNEEVNQINEETLDFVESKLLENINKGEVTSIIFYLKTKGRNRGYQEKTEIDINSLKLPQIELQEADFEEVEGILIDETKREDI